MLKTFPSDKIEVTENSLFFLQLAPTYHSFTFNWWLLYELKHKICFCKKIISLNFDHAIYQTITIFQKTSGFLEWEPILSNCKKVFRFITEKQYQKALTRDSRCFQ